jgi:hypothetical protein
MSHQPKPVGEALTFLQRATGQVSAVRKALEHAVEESMDAPGGMEWEKQVSEPPLEDEPQGPPPTPAPWEQERRKRTAAEFLKNWSGWPRRRRR